MSLSAITRDKINFETKWDSFSEKVRSVNLLSPVRFAESAHIQGSWQDLKHKIVEIGSSLRIAYILAAIGCMVLSVEMPVFVLGMIIVNECTQIALSDKKKDK